MASCDADKAAAPGPTCSSTADALPDLRGFSKEDQLKLIKIQAATRGNLTRKNAAKKHQSRQSVGLNKHDNALRDFSQNVIGDSDLPNLKSFSADDKSKITRIQAGIRGSLARKSVKSGTEGSKDFRQVRSEPGKRKSVQAGAGLPDLSSFSQDDTAKLLKIQAAARGSFVRKGNARLVTESAQALAGASASRSSADLPDLTSFTAEDTAKLTKIQAGARGLAARKKTQELAAQKTQRNPAGEAKLQMFAQESSIEQPPAKKIVKVQRPCYYLPMLLNGVQVVVQEAADRWRVTTENFQANKPNTKGLGYRKSKDLNDRVGQGALATWGDRIIGSDAGDGWLKCEVLPDLASYSAHDTARLTRIQAGARGLLARKHNPVRPKAKAGTQGAQKDSLAQGDDKPDLASFTDADTGPATTKEEELDLAASTVADKGVSATGPNLSEPAAASQELPELSSFSNEDTAKITKIQAGARGHLARRHSQEQKVSAQRQGQQQSGGANALPDLASYSEGDTVMLTKIQARARGNLSRKDQPCKNDHSQSEARKVQAADNGLPDLSSFSESDKSKLARIQATARGHQTRKSLAEQRSAEQGSMSLNADIETFDLTEVQPCAQQQVQSVEPANVHQETPAADFVPMRPPGPPPRQRRPALQPKPPPNAAKVMSEKYLTRQAEKRLQQSVQRMLTNIPGWRPHDEPCNPHAAGKSPRVLLTSLSDEARESILRMERKEAKSWLKDATLQHEHYQKRLEVEAKLGEWHAQRQAAEVAEVERKRNLEEENVKAEQQQARRWRKHGQALQHKVAVWGAEKAEREEREERAQSVVRAEARQRESERLDKRGRKLKKRLARWYTGEAPPAIADSLETGKVEADGAGAGGMESNTLGACNTQAE